MRCPLGSALGLEAAFAFLLAVSPGAAVATSRDTPAWAALERARGLFRAYHADSALPIAEEVLRSPDAARDPALAASASLLRGASLAFLGRPREAELLLRESVDGFAAEGDSVQLGSALRFLGYALSLTGRAAESIEVYRRLLAVSLARGDPSNEAFARLGLAYRDLLDGRYVEAEEGYSRAIALFRRTREDFLVRNAGVGLCRCYEGQGRIEETRRCYRDLEAACRRAGDDYNRSSCLNNLGAIEHMAGDLAAAGAAYRAAFELSQASAEILGAIAPASNLALVEIESGRLRDAEQVLEAAREIAARAGYRPGLAQLLGRTAELRVAQRRFPEALDCAHRGLALADSAAPHERTGLVATFAATLAGMGRTSEAIVAMQRESARLGQHSAPFPACVLQLELSRQLRRAGRANEALAAARRALGEARRGESLDLEFRARVEEGLCVLGLGRAAEGRARLEAALSLWEANRLRQSDPEARAQLSAAARECVSGLIESYLDGAVGGAADSRAGRAPDDVPPAVRARVFELIERFKARTLRERMAGPWADAVGDSAGPAPVTLEQVQRRVLRPGEVLVVGFLGPSVRVLVAVTERDSRVNVLPTEAHLDERLARFRSLASRAGSSADVLRFIDQAGGRLGATLLAPMRDLVERSARLVVSPDEQLGLIPWAALGSPVEDGEPPRPLIEGREVILVPSAGILADLRGRGARGGRRAAARVLAVAGRGDAGVDVLPGAAGEVRWLGHRFAGVETHEGAAEGALGIAGRFAEFDVIHLAAHASLDDQYPWRSGVRLGARLGPGADEYLRADRIAALRLGARLAVLSSCSSAAGRIASGEGVQSLSAAFLTAGTTCTVATLWPVGDREAERFMRAFYTALAAGRTTAAALRETQLEFRSRAETRHPYYWAGFVALGDGEVRVPLRPRWPVGVTAAVAIAFAGLAIWGWRAWAARKPLTRDEPGTLSG